MKDFIEKLIERLEENSFDMSLENPDCKAVWTDKAKEIVNELAEEYKPKTNADKIRSMSDEELAEFFSKRDKIPDTYKCKEVNDWIEWLQSEAE